MSTCTKSKVEAWKSNGLLVQSDPFDKLHASLYICIFPRMVVTVVTVFPVPVPVLALAAAVVAFELHCRLVAFLLLVMTRMVYIM